LHHSSSIGSLNHSIDTLKASARSLFLLVISKIICW
jgi:hypothetical protein